MTGKDISKHLSGELNDLAANSTDPVVIKKAAGENVIEVGEKGLFLYVIKTGEVEISHRGVPLETVGPGAIVGEMALIENAPRNATVTAVCDTELIPIGRWRFKYLVRKDPDFALQVMEVISRRLRMMKERLADG